MYRSANFKLLQCLPIYRFLYHKKSPVLMINSRAVFLIYFPVSSFILREEDGESWSWPHKRNKQRSTVVAVVDTHV